MDPERIMELLDDLHRHSHGVLKAKMELEKLLTKELAENYRPLIQKKNR